MSSPRIRARRGCGSRRERDGSISSRGISSSSSSSSARRRARRGEEEEWDSVAFLQIHPRLVGYLFFGGGGIPVAGDSCNIFLVAW